MHVPITKSGRRQGVWYFGPQKGAVDYLVKVKSDTEPGKDKVIGLKTKDGVVHDADAVVVAGKSRESPISYLLLLTISKPGRFRRKFSPT